MHAFRKEQIVAFPIVVSKTTKLILLDSLLQEVCINFDLTMSVNIFLVIFA